jgi:hypothetical protein
VDARYACKGNTTWTGYKAHLTETCDTDLPRIITAVQATAGPIADGDVVAPLAPTRQSHFSRLIHAQTAH